MNDNNNLTFQFLLSSIQDIQNTIRAIDAKIFAFFVILIIPLTKLSTIISTIMIVAQNKSWYILFWAVPLIFVFCISWIISFYASYKAIISRDNPADRIDGVLPDGLYYGSFLFPEKSFRLLRPKAIKSIKFEDYVNQFKNSLEKLLDELVFEQMKLVYI
ncbi:MAG: hypothetical protein MUC94_12230, partial [bacterium]|nr:hypothetical protein [bacterium]